MQRKRGNKFFVAKELKIAAVQKGGGGKKYATKLSRFGTTIHYILEK